MSGTGKDNATFAENKILVFPCNGALTGSLLDAGYAAFDLPKLCQDEGGNPTGVPPEIRTELEAVKRAGVRFLILANIQGDIAIYRIAELLKSIGIEDYEIRVINLRDSTGELETLERIRAVMEGGTWTGAKSVKVPSVRAVASFVLMPPSFMLRDDFFGCVARLIVETTDQPQPEFAVAATACLISVIVGNRIYFDVGSHRVWPHLNALCLGPSTCGKDWPRKCLERIISKAADDESGRTPGTKEIRFLYGSSSIRSDAGIRNELMTKSTTSMFALDEIGDTFEKINTAGTGQGYLSGILKTLKELKHAQGKFFRPGGTGTDGTCEIWSPHLVIYGSSTADPVWNNISVSAVEGGFLNRFQVFNGGIPKTLFTCRKWRIDEDVVQTIRAWRMAVNLDPEWGTSCAEAADPRGRIGARPEAFGPRLENMIAGNVDHEAQILYAEFNQECHAKKFEAHTVEEGLRVAIWGRVAECAVQMAAIFACSMFRKEDEPFGHLTRECMAEGIVWARWQAAKILAKIDSIGGETHHRNFDLVRDAIQLKGTITHRKLQRILGRKFPDKKMMEEAISNLIAGELIEISKGVKGGRIYHWMGDDEPSYENKTVTTSTIQSSLLPPGTSDAPSLVPVSSMAAALSPAGT